MRGITPRHPLVEFTMSCSHPVPTGCLTAHSHVPETHGVQLETRNALGADAAQNPDRMLRSEFSALTRCINAIFRHAPVARKRLNNFRAFEKNRSIHAVEHSRWQCLCSSTIAHFETAS